MGEIVTALVKQYVLFALLKERKLTDDFRKGRDIPFTMIRFIRWKQWRTPHVWYMIELEHFERFREDAETAVIRVTQTANAVETDGISATPLGCFRKVTPRDPAWKEERYHCTDNDQWYIFDTDDANVNIYHSTSRDLTLS